MYGSKGISNVTHVDMEQNCSKLDALNRYQIRRFVPCTST